MHTLFDILLKWFVVVAPEEDGLYFTVLVIEPWTT